MCHARQNGITPIYIHISVMSFCLSEQNSKSRKESHVRYKKGHKFLFPFSFYQVKFESKMHDCIDLNSYKNSHC